MKLFTRTIVASVVLIMSLGASVGLLAQSVKVVPVEVINPPDLPVPVIRTDDLPIPPDLLKFQRHYCSGWQGPRLIQENDVRKLVEYTAQIPTIYFPNHVFWTGRVSGFLGGSEENVSIGYGGAVDIVTSCGVSVPSGFAPEFFPILHDRSLNLYTIKVDDISDYACVFDDQYPVDVTIRARTLEFKGLSNDLPSAGPEGEGRVCLKLTSIRAPTAD